MKSKTLQSISVEEISANPHNPRLIFDRTELDDLKKSMSKVGILVPLTVYENTKNSPKSKFILLDGERRWRCAKELDMKEVPANVIDEPADVTQNILFMFNIHHYREEWALFPTALKLEVIIKSLGTDNEATVSNFTGVSRSMVRRCNTLLWFPLKYRDILMERNGRISTDFFIEIYPIVNRLSSEDEYPYPQGTIKLTDAFMKKFVDGKTISDVKEFREVRRAMGYYEKSNNISKFKDIINTYVSEENKGLELFVSPDIEGDITRKNLLKYISYLNSNLENINSNLISDLSFVEELNSLEKKIRILLDKLV